MADNFKPDTIKNLETLNKLTIIANHYSKRDMRVENIKIPSIEFGEVDYENCIKTLKKGYNYVKYEYMEGSSPLEITLIYLSPKFYEKKIGSKYIKYITLTYFNMIGTINLKDVSELDKLAQSTQEI